MKQERIKQLQAAEAILREFIDDVNRSGAFIQTWPDLLVTFNKANRLITTGKVPTAMTRHEQAYAEASAR